MGAWASTWCRWGPTRGNRHQIPVLERRNDLQNYPVLNVATIGPDNESEARVAGTFETVALTVYTLEFFAGSLASYS